MELIKITKDEVFMVLDGESSTCADSFYVATFTYHNSR